MVVTRAVVVLVLCWDALGAPCGRFKEVCGVSEYCDAGLGCAHCAGICDSLTGKTRENLQYACNKNCPGYLASEQSSAFTSTTVPTTPIPTTSLLRQTSLLSSIHPPQEPTVNTGANTDDSSGQVHIHTALLVFLVVIVLATVIFVWYKLLKNRKEAQNPEEIAVQQHLVDGHPADDINQDQTTRQQDQTEQVAIAATVTALPIDQPALVRGSVNRESQNVPQVNTEPCNAPLISASVSTSPQNVSPALVSVKIEDSPLIATANNRSDRQTQSVEIVQHVHSEQKYLPTNIEDQEMVPGPENVRNKQSQQDTTDQSVTCAKEPVQTMTETRGSNQTALNKRTPTYEQSLASSGYRTSTGNYVCTPVEDSAEPS